MDALIGAVVVVGFALLMAWGCGKLTETEFEEPPKLAYHPDNISLLLGEAVLEDSD